MYPDKELKGLLASAMYMDEWTRRPYQSGPAARRKAPRTKQTIANRAKNKQARKSRKRNRK